MYPFGDAHSYGSPPAGSHIVGLASTPDGHGYWEVSSTGVIFAYGDAHSYGSLPKGITDVIGIAATAHHSRPD